jgi:hypothetical protein
VGTLDRASDSAGELGKFDEPETLTAAQESPRRKPLVIYKLCTPLHGSRLGKSLGLILCSAADMLVLLPRAELSLRQLLIRLIPA